MTPSHTITSLLAEAACRPPAVWDRSVPVHIFGTGGFASDVAKILLGEGFQIACFIQSTPDKTTFMGYPVRSWETAQPQAETPLLIGLFNRNTPLTLISGLAEQHGYEQCRFPWDIYSEFGQSLGWRYWLSHPQTLCAAAEHLNGLHARLDDEISRQCLMDLVAFRVGLNPQFAAFTHEEPQYFNALTLPALPARNLYYVDGGAYNGDSLQHLMSKHPVERAYLFEPDPENFAHLTTAAQAHNWPSICFPLGLHDRYQTLSFNAGQGEGCNLAQDGTLHITCAGLDQVLGQHPVDLIKLDVEGAEIAALEGARQIILNHQPILAISLYHQPDDLWRIPATIDAIAPGYRFAIRQHCFNSFDSVLYALPAH